MNLTYNLTCDYDKYEPGGCPERTTDLFCETESQTCICSQGYHFNHQESRCLDDFGCSKGTYWHSLIVKCIASDEEGPGPGVQMGIGVFFCLMLVILVIRSARFCVRRAVANHATPISIGSYRKPSTDSARMITDPDMAPIVVVTLSGYSSVFSASSHPIQGELASSCSSSSTRTSVSTSNSMT